MSRSVVPACLFGGRAAGFGSRPRPPGCRRNPSTTTGKRSRSSPGPSGPTSTWASPTRRRGKSRRRKSASERSRMPALRAARSGTTCPVRLRPTRRRAVRRPYLLERSCGGPRRVASHVDPIFALARLHQIVRGLSAQPELGIRPSRLLQTNCHLRGDGHAAVQHARERVTGHAQDPGRFRDVQTEGGQAVLLDAETGVRGAFITIVSIPCWW